MTVSFHKKSPELAASCPTNVLFSLFTLNCIYPLLFQLQKLSKSFEYSWIFANICYSFKFHANLNAAFNTIFQDPYVKIHSLLKYVVVLQGCKAKTSMDIESGQFCLEETHGHLLVQTLPRSGSARAGCSGLCLVGFWVWPRINSTTSLINLFWVMKMSYWKYFSSCWYLTYVSRNACFIACFYIQGKFQLTSVLFYHVFAKKTSFCEEKNK